MTRLTRQLFGVVVVSMGAIPPHVMYATSKDGNIWNPSIFGGLLVCSLISFACFAVIRKAGGGRSRQTILGTVASYSIFLLIVIVSSAVAGDIAETVMWLPILLAIGILYMAPLIAMSWIGCQLVYSVGPTKSEQVIPPNAR